MSNNKTGGLALLTGLIVGGLAGVTAGVLFAPKEGAKTRKELADKVEKIRKQGDEAFQKLRKERIDPFIKDVRREIDTKVGDIRKDLKAREAK